MGFGMTFIFFCISRFFYFLVEVYRNFLVSIDSPNIIIIECKLSYKLNIALIELTSIFLETAFFIIIAGIPMPKCT